MIEAYVTILVDLYVHDGRAGPSTPTAYDIKATRAPPLNPETALKPR